MHSIFRTFPLLAWLSVAACGSATAQKSAFAAASRSFTGPDGRLDYVAPLRTLLGQAAGYEPGSYAQALVTYFSFVGQTAPVPPSAGQNPAIAYRLAEVPALVRARARATSVVLINEAHDQPAHRAYCRQLLAQLAPLGYSYFAVEALNPADTAIATRKYPVSASGFYTCEPVMGQLLRAAADGGFHVFGHEITELQEREFASFERRTSYRDSMQAVNILAVLRRHPGAKIVALVGYDHVLEKERDGVKRLATYLHELAGIDPFTIDQTQGYRPATGPHATHPQALTTVGGRPATVGSNAGYVDLQIIHLKGASTLLVLLITATSTCKSFIRRRRSCTAAPAGWSPPGPCPLPGPFRRRTGASPAWHSSSMRRNTAGTATRPFRWTSA